MLDHARDRTLPSQTGRGHLEVSFDSCASETYVHLVEVGIGPHIDRDVQDADFNETRLPSQKYNDQYTGLELDPVGTAAARQSEIDFAWRLKAFEPRPGRKRISEWDGSLSGCGGLTVTRG